MELAQFTPEDDAPAGIGHNGAPKTEFEIASEALAKWLAVADEWAKREELDDLTAPKANDFIAGAKKFWKKVDGARADEKKPHDDAAKAVQAKWTPLLDTIKKIHEGVQPKLDAYLRKQKAIADAAKAEAARKAKEAEEERRRAELEAANAKTESARLEAEQRAKELAATVKAETKAANAGPVKVESATGLANRVSLREPRRIAKVTDVRRAVLHYIDTPEMLELVQRLAAAELRHSKGANITIPGVIITTEEEEGLAV